MSATVTDKRKKWGHFISSMKGLNGEGVKIGLQQGSTHKDEDSGDVSDLVEIGAKHEFGDPEDNIPERSFIRSTSDEQSLAVKALMDQEYTLIALGIINENDFLRGTGEFMEGKIKKKITDIRYPPNSPATIAKKGSSNPLIDTEQMRASIRYVKLRAGV